MLGVEDEIVDWLVVQIGEIFDLCEKVSDHHYDLTIVPPGHQGGACGVTGACGSVVALEELVGSHGEEDVLVPAATEEEHAAGGVEAEHGVLALKILDGHLEVHVEAELMVGEDVGEEGREAQAVADGEVIVYHGGPGVHAYLAGAHLEEEAIVDVYLMTRREERDSALVLSLVEIPELGEV